MSLGLRSWPLATSRRHPGPTLPPRGSPRQQMSRRPSARRRGSSAERLDVVEDEVADHFTVRPPPLDTELPRQASFVVLASAGDRWRCPDARLPPAYPCPVTSPLSSDSSIRRRRWLAIALAAAA